MEGYNDDLPMSLAIGLWVRDTALRLKAEGIQLQKTVLNKMLDYEPLYTPEEETAEGWDWELRGEKEDLTWLIWSVNFGRVGKWCASRKQRLLHTIVSLYRYGVDQHREND